MPHMEISLSVRLGLHYKNLICPLNVFPWADQIPFYIFYVLQVACHSSLAPNKRLLFRKGYKIVEQRH